MYENSFKQQLIKLRRAALRHPVRSLIVFGVVFVFLWSRFWPASSPSDDTSAPSQSPSIAAVPPSQAPSSIPEPARPSSTATIELTSAEAAVQAAATATSQLAYARFETGAAKASLVDTYISPSYRQAYRASSTPDINLQVAISMGWASVAEARDNAQVNVDPQKFRLIQLSTDTADVGLYLVSSYQKSVPNDQTVRDLIRTPTIVVVHMERVGKHWMYAGTDYPAVNQTIAAQEKGSESFEKLSARFQPYLKGFRNYVPTANPGS